MTLTPAEHAALDQRIALAPQLPRRQDPTNSQMRDLIIACQRMGFQAAWSYLLARFPGVNKPLGPLEPGPARAILKLSRMPVIKATGLLQLQAAHRLANRLGLGDAADAVRNILEQTPSLDAK